ncbi:MAG: hypothetical protein ABI151_10845 [Chitinophagaceae bacterium]
MYLVNSIGNNLVTVLILKKGAPDQLLAVSEKNRKHLFILSYKAGSIARREDLSNRKKTNDRSNHSKKNIMLARTEADTLFDRAKRTASGAASWKDVEARYRRLVRIVADEDTGYLNSRLEEIEMQLRALHDTRYDQAIKDGEIYTSQKNYGEAKKSFATALEAKPGDSLALKSINLLDMAWAKNYVEQGDEASKSRKAILAKTFYQKAMDIKPDYPSLKNKLTQAKLVADPQIYALEKEKGDLAINDNNLSEARTAYDSALVIRPDDKYVKGQVRKLITLEEKNAKEEKDDAAYQDLLVIAKDLADKASTAQQYELAIKEYRRAMALIPGRQFPGKKIAELTNRIKQSR